MTETDHQYINRIFSLLDCFSVDQPELRVREAARMLNISPSSCGRLLSEMRDEGILIQDPETRSYALGGRVIRWAGTYTATSDLRKKAFPYMTHIFEQTNETISLYEAGDYDRVCIERLESHQNVRIVEMVGTRIKIYAGSGGKAILAFRSPEEIEQVIQYALLQPENQGCEKEFDQLRNELSIIRQSGYAISHGEWLSDASGVASPIFNAHAIPIGAISISGPSQRFQDNEKLNYYGNLLLKNVSAISRDLGYYSTYPVKEGSYDFG